MRLILLIALCMTIFSCKVQRDVIRSDLKEMESKSDVNLATQSHTEIKTSLDTGKVVNSTTTTTETTFGQFVDPKTGELKSLPVSQKTTETITKTEQRGKKDESVKSDQTAKAEIKQDESAKEKSKSRSNFKMSLSWIWIVIILAGVMIVWNPLILTKILTLLKKLLYEVFYKICNSIYQLIRRDDT